MSVYAIICHLGLVKSQDFIRGTSHPYMRIHLNHPHQVSSYQVMNLLTILNAFRGGGGIQAEHNDNCVNV